MPLPEPGQAAGRREKQQGKKRERIFFSHKEELHIFLILHTLVRKYNTLLGLKLSRLCWRLAS